MWAHYCHYAQYTYLGHGKSIHSAAQLEYYRNNVNDQSIKVQGGLQCIMTLDGYVIPIYIISGLPYVHMHLYTHEEWETLPHVILTADINWDPSVLDHMMEDDEHWYAAICNLEQSPYTSMFDEEGNYLGCVIIQHAKVVCHELTFYDASNELPPKDIDSILDQCIYVVNYHCLEVQAGITNPSPHLVVP
jgi:hypothetical protein